VDKAKTANMPNDNIERAIQKGLGGGDTDAFEECIYEGYGPAGVAILVETLTDNKNRTVGEVRHLLNKYGGNLGANGCVSYLFEKKGLLHFDREGVDGDALMEAALEAGANDVDEEESEWVVETAPSDFDAVKAALEASGFAPSEAEVSMEPTTTVKLEGKEAQTMLTLSEALEDLDDVQNVYANFDISEEEMASFA
jgi:YebC/PmpR family DNA-binding regulatory protein